MENERGTEAVGTTGAYSYSAAARLLNVSAEKVRKWSKGYTRKVRYSEERRAYAPVLQTDHESGYVSFLELVELIYCREFRKLDVTLPTIRRAAENLAREVGPYPFASRELLVGGRRLVETLGDDLVLDAASQQIMLRVGEFLRPQVSFGDDARVGRLFAADATAIYLDPRVRFGEPVLASRPVPVQTVAKLFAVERDEERVAEYFRIAPLQVRQAVAFHDAPRLLAA